MRASFIPRELCSSFIVTAGAMALAVPILAVPILAVPTQAGPLLPLSQSRTTSAFVIVPPCGGMDSDNDAATDFDEFLTSIDAIRICDFAQGIACSTQFSHVGSSVLDAWGIVTSNAVSSSQTVIHSISTSKYDVTFMIGVGVEYEIDGLLNASGDAVGGGYARVELSASGEKGGPAIYSESANLGAGGADDGAIVHVFGLLPPGTYRLLIDGLSGIDATIPPNGTIAADFNVTFHAAIPGDVNDDNLVNIDDLFDVLASWGACPSQPPGTPSQCPADIAPLGGNSMVNVDDLFKVIANWS